MLSTPSYTKIYFEKKNLSYLYNIHTFFIYTRLIEFRRMRISNFIIPCNADTEYMYKQGFFFLCKQTGSVRKKPYKMN